MNKGNFAITISVSALVLSVAWAVNRPPAVDPLTISWVDPALVNHDILETVEFGLEDKRTVPINIRIPNQRIVYEFRVHTPTDVVQQTTVTAPGQVIVLVRTAVQVDPNDGSKLAVYEVSLTPDAVGQIYLDIEVLAASQPTIFPVTGPIANAAPWWLPHGVAWLNDPNTPVAEKQVVWQKARKVVGEARTSREINDMLYAAWQRGEVTIP